LQALFIYDSRPGLQANRNGEPAAVHAALRLALCWRPAGLQRPL